MTAEAAVESVSRRKVRARASAKVNLQLSVGPAREDGYHPLATVFQAVDLYEIVTASARNDGKLTLTLDALPSVGASGEVPLDESNLAWKAALAVRERYGIDDGADLHILKGVPVAGGMAGGSADAAAALLACSQLWDCGASRDELMELAADLGADVPFALLGHTALGLGRGDELSPAMSRGEFHWVFALQAHGLSTAKVFSTFDDLVAAGEIIAHEPRVREEVMAALMAGDPARLGAALSNDLQAVAISLAPHLEDVIGAMIDADALGAIVSGSGPTVAGLARSRPHAMEVAQRVRESGLAHAVVCAGGPATGAVIIGG